MKKLLLSATACFLMAASIKAQEIQPCGTYQAREYFIKNLPGYAAKLNAAEAASRAEYQAFLQQNAASKTSSVQPTYTVPVVFHILHQGEPYGTGANIDDNECILALAQVNSDYGKLGLDVNQIDPLFQPLYEDANMRFVLAQKDPQGNCTNGIIHHYDDNTQWSQGDVFNYKYSTYGIGDWNPSKYLNIYIVKNIVSGGPVVGGGIIVGYTYLPGTSPVTAADAIVYRNDFLTGGLNARSLSHEIGHWFGLSHTFGSSNEPGFECGNDDIADTPPTTGFFSTCPKPAAYTTAPVVSTPADSSDITRVKFGKMDNITALNSLNGTIVRNLFTFNGTSIVPLNDTSNVVATGTAGEYSDFSMVYGNDFNAGGAAQTITITSVAKAAENNYVGVYIDYNKDGDFADASENIFTSSASLFGTQTFTASHVIPAASYALYRMRVITSNVPVTGATASLTNGEFEEYNLNIGTTPSPTTGVNKTMATCDATRPNIENIMDYSSCPKMFTKGQNDKVRLSATSAVGNRSMLITNENLYFTGILNRTITFNSTTNQNDTVYTPTTVSPCAPVADFASNKMSTCAGQSIVYTSTAFNGTGLSYVWQFEGGTPSTSTAAIETVTYSTPGSYSVSLTVTNAQGVSTKTISSVVTNWNSNAPAFVSDTLSEDFENFQGFAAGWFVPSNNDIGSPTWEISNQYGAGFVPGQTKSLVLPNANGDVGVFGNAGHVDIIETASYDFSNVSNLGFQFDYSFARKTGVTRDTFKVQYSLDCGGTWKTFIGSPTASVMATNTGSIVNAPYNPWSTATSYTATNYKWETVVIPSFGTSPLVGKRDVKFRFWFKNDVDGGESQNLYLDNINISGTVGIREFENSLGLSIYPNPTNGASVVEFTSPNNSKVNILVYHVTGRIVEQNELNANAGVTNKHAVNASGKLTAGIYFVSLTIDNNKVVKKLIIN
ncbi:MAG: T9SS type A sorting domain-containing protein [Bacteroidetes bacterium]|nr:T9SS type A sorting domain-containing protein [Bacteroidota bacterium]